MVTAVDSSVLLDILIDNEFAGRSEQALLRASGEGSLIVCECVIAEVYPAIGKNISNFLGDYHIEFRSIDLEAAKLAGQYFQAYLGRRGRQKRIVADFLIGAHALAYADRLLARDRGYLRDYFKGLKVWNPA
jgi:predicted nucleic acid-binding protein